MQQQGEHYGALHAARCIADHAVGEGILKACVPMRPVYHHMGAVLADSVLQAGLNYSTIVRPRVQAIIEVFPHATTLDALTKIIEAQGSSRFLQWQHEEKVSRFDELLRFLVNTRIKDTTDLCEALLDNAFRSDLREIKGIGPKTVDYMACLVGVDCIAVDRHIRGFAELAGVTDDGYDYLRDVFNFAADLLSISRRQFDASIWHYQASKNARQMMLDFDCDTSFAN
ncbi:hypothetical protein [uncultured Ruegeria sp.]|uniref:hypothetical protein n=1 Tax=uncultured Ruegeria sp. TaxID=259304 RepID=UPI00262E5CCA|nr:hypothetical protein [uncultured Ruegeria sp.]